ncbi:hypothetical protein BC826DRAFT_170983 [Russula brevipes]|nr:hypothetical protein BC826DRAFT_170983 [Russula brevipes]
MTRVAEPHPSHAENTSIPLSSTQSDTTACFLHESDVQGTISFDVLLTRLESLSNRIRTVIRTPSPRAVAPSSVDRGIDAAILLTRALLTHRNTLAPVSVLPPEVLARIFHLLPPDSYSPETGRLEWIGVTHVCRHWRQVALDDSSLWARILCSTANTTWISETLARARNAPLAIDLCGTWNAKTLSMFAAHFAHTHEFRLHGTPRLFYDIREIWSLEAPALEHFALGADADFPVTHLRAPFFNGMAPKLRTFSLNQICVPWSFIPRGQLSKLKITLFDNGGPLTDGPSLGDSKSLIDLLINCPMLEILVLESCLPQSITRPSHVQAIHLPRLSQLCLDGSSSRVANLLEILKLPPSTKLRISCTSENMATNNDHRILPLLSAHLHRDDPASVEIKSFQVYFFAEELRSICFTASTYLPTLTTDPSYVFESDVNGPPALYLSFAPPFEVDVDTVGQVCSMLPISNIEYLSISAPKKMNRPLNCQWGELFQRCAKLTTIHLDGREASGLLKDSYLRNPRKRLPARKREKGSWTTEGSQRQRPAAILPLRTCLCPFSQT